MSGLIIDISDNIGAIIVILSALSAIWRWIVRPIREGVERLEQLMGSNDKSTVFDQLAKIASLVDVIDQPSLFISTDGEIYHANLAFTDKTSLSQSSLQYGGWRQLFDPDAQDEWDRSVEHRSVFARTLSINGRTWNVLAKPVFNAKKFLGWRVRLTELLVTQ